MKLTQLHPNKPDAGGWAAPRPDPERRFSLFLISGFLFLVSALAGCTQYVAPPSAEVSSPAVSGLVHSVARGETLWSISRRYGVELEDLVRANRISDASRIEVGERIRIPPTAGAGYRPEEERPLKERTTAPVSEEAALSDAFIWPVQGKVISAFGMRRSSTINKGIDIQAPEGAQVLAARGGRVSFVHEQMPGFGRTIILDHGEGFATVYAYIGEILIQPGQIVSQRQVIARVGKSGRAQVPALHFEIRRNQKPQNPFYYLP